MIFVLPPVFEYLRPPCLEWVSIRGWWYPSQSTTIAITLITMIIIRSTTVRRKHHCIVMLFLSSFYSTPRFCSKYFYLFLPSAKWGISSNLTHLFDSKKKEQIKHWPWKGHLLGGTLLAVDRKQTLVWDEAEWYDHIGMFLQIDWFDHTNTLVEAADYQVDTMVFPNDRLFESRSTMHFIPR